MLSYSQSLLRTIRENRAKALSSKPNEAKVVYKSSPVIQAVVETPKKVVYNELIWPIVGYGVKHTVEPPLNWYHIKREDLPTETIGMITRIVKSVVYYQSTLTGKEESFNWRFRNLDNEWHYNKLFQWSALTEDQAIILQAASKYKQSMESFLKDIE